jgi:hypothetical protein
VLREVLLVELLAGADCTKSEELLALCNRSPEPINQAIPRLKTTTRKIRTRLEVLIK